MKFFRPFHKKVFVVPLVLFLLDLLFSLFFFQFRRKFMGDVAIYCAAGAVISGWISAITGLVSLLQIRQQPMASGVAAIHGFISLLALMILTLLWMKTRHSSLEETFNTATTLFKLLGLGILFLGSFLARRILSKHTATL
jgi:uncharacterized membrane protein